MKSTEGGRDTYRKWSLVAVRRRNAYSTVIQGVTAINGVSWLLASDIDTVLVKRTPSGKVLLLALADRSVYPNIARREQRRGLRSHPLARQKYWQIRTNFTTLLLRNYNLKLNCEHDSKNLPASLTCLVLL